MSTPSPLNGATIVFDLDGTLVETAPDLMGTLNHLLTREGLPPLPMSEARNLIGAGAKALLARGFAAAGEPLPEDKLERLFDDFIPHYLGRIADESHPFEGVMEAIDAMAAEGAIMAVCTNKRTDLSLALMERLNIAHRFAAIIGGDLAPAQKPDGRHLALTIERAGGRLDKAVMIGDSAADAGAARNAGVPLILVSFGYTDVPASELGGDILLDHFAGLKDACIKLLS